MRLEIQLELDELNEVSSPAWQVFSASEGEHGAIDVMLVLACGIAGVHTDVAGLAEDSAIGGPRSKAP